MHQGIQRYIVAIGLLVSVHAEPRSVKSPPPWEIVVLHADFIGTVTVTANSFTGPVHLADGSFAGNHVFVECLVTDSVKGVPENSAFVLDLGAAENRFGDPVPSAQQGNSYFVVAYCQYGAPGGNSVHPPADYFLSGYSRWLRLPWSYRQTLNALRMLGSDHMSLEEFVSDARALLSQGPELQELTAIKAYTRHELREWFPLIDSESPTREQAAMLNAQDLQSAINALVDFKAVPKFAEDVLLESAGSRALEYLRNEREPHIILSGDYLRKLASYVEWREPSCGHDHERSVEE